MYWHLYERKLVENSSGLVFTLQREMENSKWTFPFSPVRTFVVAPSGMVPVSPLAANEVPDTQVRQDDAAKIALFLGRVHPKKRPDLLIEAWSAAGLPSDWRLLIAGFGDPAYLNQLAKLAKQKGVGDSIQFVGPVAGVNKRYLFQRASWFLLPSHQENFGVAVLEAASAGCAIAISDQVYLADEFPKGAEVLPVQVDAWTRFMRERMTNAAWRDETAQRVSDHLKAKFDQESVVRRWVDMICSGLGTTVSAGPQ
jgi:glycosyltransferase involved in cell wall biosynthesis